MGLLPHLVLMAQHGQQNLLGGLLALAVQPSADSPCYLHLHLLSVSPHFLRRHCTAVALSVMHVAKALGPADIPGKSPIMAWAGLRCATLMARYTCLCECAGGPPLLDVVGGQQMIVASCEAFLVSSAHDQRHWDQHVTTNAH